MTLAKPFSPSFVEVTYLCMLRSHGLDQYDDINFTALSVHNVPHMYNDVPHTYMHLPGSSSVRHAVAPQSEGLATADAPFPPPC